MYKRACDDEADDDARLQCTVRHMRIIIITTIRVTSRAVASPLRYVSRRRIVCRSSGSR